MIEPVNVYDAKTRLSQLIDRAARGEEVIIARAGRPVARLIAFCGARAHRKPCRLRKRIRVARNFDTPLPSDLFSGGEL